MENDKFIIFEDKHFWLQTATPVRVSLKSDLRTVLIQFFASVGK